MTSLTTEIRPVFCPTPPEKIEDVGVSEGLLLDLIVRRLSLEGTANLTGLGEKLKLSYPVISHLFNTMRQHHLVEVKGMLGNDYWITLSGAGRTLASERLQISK
jgi:hypothetical protein